MLPLLPWTTGPTWAQASVAPGVLPFRSHIDLVRVAITARDSERRFVRDLSASEFQIYEDGVRQDVRLFGHDETPISVVLLLDDSESMQGEKMMHAKDAVLNFVRALRAGDEVRLLAFNDFIDPLVGFGLDATPIANALQRVDARNGTRLYDAVIAGATDIITPGRRDKRAIVILSDGEDTHSAARIGEAVEAVRVAEVPAYAIGIEYEGHPWWARRYSNRSEPSGLSLLRQITDGTGGWTYPIRAAKRCTQVCLRIADELRNQYLLGYYPTTHAVNGGWRTIEVRTTRRTVTLSTRAGYYDAGARR